MPFVSRLALACVLFPICAFCSSCGTGGPSEEPWDFPTFSEGAFSPYSPFVADPFADISDLVDLTDSVQATMALDKYKSFSFNPKKRLVQCETVLNLLDGKALTLFHSSLACVNRDDRKVYSEVDFAAKGSQSKTRESLVSSYAQDQLALALSPNGGEWLALESFLSPVLGFNTPQGKLRTRYEKEQIVQTSFLVENDAETGLTDYRFVSGVYALMGTWYRMVYYDEFTVWGNAVSQRLRVAYSYDAVTLPEQEKAAKAYEGFLTLSYPMTGFEVTPALDASSLLKNDFGLDAECPMIVQSSAYSHALYRGNELCYSGAMLGYEGYPGLPMFAAKEKGPDGEWAVEDTKTFLGLAQGKAGGA